jgi:uncharacterized cupin superfamily protein
MIVVLEGHPTAHLGDRSVRLGPGDFLGFEPGTGERHFIGNESTDVARLLVIASTPQGDRVCYEDAHRGT